MTNFHSSWQWTSGVDTVRLYLNTTNVFFNINGGFTWDRLVGWYFYKKGNNIICSNYNAI